MAPSTMRARQYFHVWRVPNGSMMAAERTLGYRVVDIHGQPQVLVTNRYQINGPQRARATFTTPTLATSRQNLTLASITKVPNGRFLVCGCRRRLWCLLALIAVAHSSSLTPAFSATEIAPVDDPTYWNAAAIVYAEVVNVVQRENTYDVVLLQPLATLSGNLDPAYVSGRN